MLLIIHFTVHTLFSDKSLLIVYIISLFKENIKIDKKEEDIMLKELLRDDFIDDPNLEPDYENCPVKLPLNKGNIIFIFFLVNLCRLFCLKKKINL